MALDLFGLRKPTQHAAIGIAIVAAAALLAGCSTASTTSAIVLSKIGLSNTVFGVALVLIMFQLPFGVFLMRNSFESIPKELEEAALVDGASTLGALRYVSLRLVTPGIVTVALFSFLASWNEYLAPLVFLNDSSQYTLPLLLTQLTSNTYGVVDYGALQAGVVLAIVPVLLLYLLLQRFYVSGLVNGALRG